MDINDTLTLLVLYRLAAILAGLVAIYIGYRLFVLGVFEKAGEIKARWGDKHLAMKQVAPGVFFALFGVVIIATSLWKGIDLEKDSLLHGAGQNIPSLMLGDDYKNVTPEIKAVLEKIIAGEPLPLNERENLQKWYKTERVRIRIEAYKPPSPADPWGRGG